MAKLSFVGNSQFTGWQDMFAVREGIWAYQSPDNTQRAMVDITTNTVLLLQDARSNEVLYKDPDISKVAKRTAVKKLRVPMPDVRRVA